MSDNIGHFPEEILPIGPPNRIVVLLDLIDFDYACTEKKFSELKKFLQAAQQNVPWTGQESANRGGPNLSSPTVPNRCRNLFWNKRKFQSSQ